MARALSQLGLLLMAAALSVAQADAAGRSGGLVDLKVKLSVKNHCAQGMRLVLGEVKGKVLEVKAGALAVLGPVKLDVRLGDILKVVQFVRNGNGRLLKVHVVANIDLKVVARLLNGVYDLALEVVENKKDKVLELVAGKAVVAMISLKALIEVGLHI